MINSSEILLILLFPINVAIIQSGGFIDIYINSNELVNISGVQSDLYFNSSIIQIDYAQQGSLFNNYSTYYGNGTIDNINGSIKNLFTVILGHFSDNKPGSLTKIRFKIMQIDKVSYLNLSNVKVADMNGNRVDVIVSNSSYKLTYGNITGFVKTN